MATSKLKLLFQRSYCFLVFLCFINNALGMGMASLLVSFPNVNNLKITWKPSVWTQQRGVRGGLDEASAHGPHCLKFCTCPQLPRGDWWHGSHKHRACVHAHSCTCIHTHCMKKTPPNSHQRARTWERQCCSRESPDNPSSQARHGGLGV